MKKQAPVIYLGSTAGRIYAHKWAYAATFLGIFVASYLGLTALGVTPEVFRAPAPVITEHPSTITSPVVATGEGELPVRIEIPSLNIGATVSNPQSSSATTLDTALLSGTVRYPGSGVLGEKGNVLIFGHSSHLPVVHNQAFKAFTDIQNLKVGEPIYVFGENEIYIYAVENVTHANTATDSIPLSSDGALLTLATCDNFGTKQDRWIVTAKLHQVLPNTNQ